MHTVSNIKYRHDNRGCGVVVLTSQARAEAVPGTGGDDVRDDHLHRWNCGVRRSGEID